MNQLVPYMIKSTSILLILLVYYKLFLNKQTFFRLNRLYLSSALLIAIVTPFISIEIQALQSSAEVQHPFKVLLDEVYVIGNYSTEASTGTTYNFNGLFIIYWIGVLFFSFRYLWALAQILKLKHNCKRKHFHGINIIKLPTSQNAFSYFNNLFIPFDLSREDRRKIFEHEKIHIRQCHSLDLLFADIICISNWFNPLVWIFKDAIINNHEYIADRQVIQRFRTGSYLELLIRQTFRGAFSFSNYYSCSNLKKRTIMMTKKQSQKYWILSFIPVTAVLVTLLYGFTCNTIYATPKSTPEVTAAIPQDSLSTKASDQVFMVVEQMPRMDRDARKWVSENVVYPTEAVEKNIQGRVYVQFIVEKDGSLTNIKVKQEIHPSLDQEAIRLIKAMPKWIPGKQRGQIVRVNYTFPVNFQLSPSNPKTSEQPIPVSNETFLVVENMPKFSNGKVQDWLAKNMKYPEAAKEKNIEGKVFVKFNIEADGSITDPVVIRSVSPELDQEAIRLVKAMPKWQPGTQRGQKVKVSYTLPIHFSLPK